MCVLWACFPLSESAPGRWTLAGGRGFASLISQTALLVHVEKGNLIAGGIDWVTHSDGRGAREGADKNQSGPSAVAGVEPGRRRARKDMRRPAFTNSQAVFRHVPEMLGIPSKVLVFHTFRSVNMLIKAGGGETQTHVCLCVCVRTKWFQKKINSLTVFYISGQNAAKM